MLYHYEDSMQRFEVQLQKNLIKLKDYRHSKRESSSNFIIVDDVYIVIKWYLETARKNFSSLRSEYCGLNQRFSGLSQESNFSDEFYNYLKCQEILRLKFLERIRECKRLITCLDDILYGSLVETLDENSNQNTFERISIVRRHLNTAVPFDISSVSMEDIALLKLDLNSDNPPVEAVEPNSCSDKGTERLVASELPKSTQHANSATTSASNSCSFVAECDSTIFSDADCEKKEKSVSSEQNVATNVPVHHPLVRNIRGQNFKRGHHSKSKTSVRKGRKSFKCIQCRKMFKSKHHLLSHGLSRHTPYHTRPYECDLCGKRFVSESHLNQHKRSGTHSQIQFYCTTCGKIFKSDASRNCHQRTAHHRIVMKLKHISDEWIRESYHNCPHCSRPFKYKKALARHIEKNHS